MTSPPAPLEKGQVRANPFFSLPPLELHIPPPLPPPAPLSRGRRITAQGFNPGHYVTLGKSTLGIIHPEHNATLDKSTLSEYSLLRNLTHNQQPSSPSAPFKGPPYRSPGFQPWALCNPGQINPGHNSTLSIM